MPMGGSVTRINKSDPVLALLRGQLERLEKTSATSKTGRKEKFTQSPLERLRAIEALDDLGEEEQQKLLVRALLTEAFGSDVANDPGFVRIVDVVYDALSQDKDSLALIKAGLTDIRS